MRNRPLELLAFEAIARALPGGTGFSASRCLAADGTNKRPWGATQPLLSRDRKGAVRKRPGIIRRRDCIQPHWPPPISA